MINFEIMFERRKQYLSHKLYTHLYKIHPSTPQKRKNYVLTKWLIGVAGVYDVQWSFKLVVSCGFSFTVYCFFFCVEKQENIIVLKQSRQCCLSLFYYALNTGKYYKLIRI